jgi:autophagy-related protein 2
MAFFFALSLTIGRKLLLFRLHHVEVFDKDPVDFASVYMGKKTTLGLRDVGLLSHW